MGVNVIVFINFIIRYWHIPSGRCFCQIRCAAVAHAVIDCCSNLLMIVWTDYLALQSSIFTCIAVDFIWIQSAQPTHALRTCNGRRWWHWHMLSWHWIIIIVAIKCVFTLWTFTDVVTTCHYCRWQCTTFICFPGWFTRRTRRSNDHCHNDHTYTNRINDNFKFDFSLFEVTLVVAVVVVVVVVSFVIQNNNITMKAVGCSIHFVGDYFILLLFVFGQFRYTK